MLSLSVSNAPSTTTVSTGCRLQEGPKEKGEIKHGYKFWTWYMYCAASGKGISTEEINYVPSLDIDAINMNHMATTLIQNSSAATMPDSNHDFKVVKQRPVSSGMDTNENGSTCDRSSSSSYVANDDGAIAEPSSEYCIDGWEMDSGDTTKVVLYPNHVRAVHSGTATLKDATSEAIRDWATNFETTHYILGSVAGPHPYPMMVRDFHAVIGKETRKQALEKWGGKPDVLVACVGGGSNAMGLFHEFVDDKDVRLIGVEAVGFGLDSGKHATTLTKGEVGVLHGAMSYLLHDDGQIIEPHSVSAG
ncbi:hypothetical protein M8C21_001550 [Ambrosia artemisiifolia]|uniref:Tryptophan synthase n=1 Tax=Ambrosia artemisiifolia TaxID=4212 RepID=A0AAD5GJM9_AMBAR|nr:hypothetical protein M8C21_001550 [Ambrosia artemisiifolia]